MGFRFRKSIKILPGVRINLSKKGVSSISIGRRGATVNIRANGEKRATFGIPGTGLSWQTRLDKPVSRRMTECPYCGHRMRKQWERCPQCGGLLVQEDPEAKAKALAAQEKAAQAETAQTDAAQSGNAPAGDAPDEEAHLSCTGCLSFLFLLGLILYFVH